MHPAEGFTLSLLDDEVSTTVPLGFNFEYYCTVYNQVRIASNGFITFDFGTINNAMTPYAQSMPSTTGPNGNIAWNWNDLDPSTATGGGVITYTTIGVPPDQKFIVTYSAVPIWTITAPPASNLLNTGQIVLHETSNIIEIHIQKAVNNGWLTHTEGIEDQTGTSGMFVPGRNLALWTATNSSHMFSPYLITTANFTAAGTPTLCQGTIGNYSATASPTPVSYGWMFPPGWSGSGNGTVTSAVAGSSGNVSVTANYSCGASPAVTIPVQVSPAPLVNLSGGTPTSLCNGYAVTFTPTGASSYTLFPDSATSNGPLSVYLKGNTMYTITGTSPEGCTSLIPALHYIKALDAPTISVNSGSICTGKTFTMIPTGGLNYTYSSVFFMVTPPVGVHQYTVTGDAPNGCTAKAISTITVNPPLPVSISSERKKMCRYEDLVLTASGATAYVWVNINDTSSAVHVSPLTTTSYSVRGTDLNGCIATGTITIDVSACPGLNEESRRDLIFYPNPARRILYVESENSTEISFSDIMGKVVFSVTVDAGKTAIELPFSLSPGMYIFTANGISRKIILALQTE